MYPIPNRLWQCIVLFFASLFIGYSPSFFLDLDAKIIMLLLFPMIACVLFGIIWLISLFKKRPLPIIRVSVSRNSLLLIFFAALTVIGVRFGFWAFAPHESGASQSSVYILSAILIGPIVEEFIFRGVFLNGLLKRYSAWFSIISISLFFGLLHFDYSMVQLQQDISIQVVNFIQGFILGIILGFVFWKTGSITPSILLHFLANLISIMVLDNLSVKSTTIQYTIGAFACVLATFAFVVSFKQQVNNI